MNDTNLSMENIDQFDGVYSLGTSVALSTILGVLSVPDVQYNILLINIETLIRNAFDVNNNIKKQAMLVKSEYDNLIAEIANVVNTNSYIEQFTIIPYLSIYKKTLPKISWKQDTAKRSLMGTIVNKTIVDFQKIQMQQTNKVTIDPLIYIGPMLITKVLRTKLHKVATDKRILMLSHIPLDFHIFKFYKKSHIVESFTGNLINVDPKTLGHKVFGLDTVPFVEGTHPFFGDKYLVRNVMNRKDKKQVLELAEKRMWHLKSTYTIQSDIEKSIGVRIPFKVF